MVNVKIDTARKVYGDYSAYITFDYDFRLVEIMRTMTDKYYNAKDKEWEMSLQNLPSFLELADGYSITLTCDNCRDKFQQEKSKELGTLPDGFRYKTIPYEHQEIAVKYGLSHESWLLGDEAGLGKTKITIDIAVARKQKHNIKHCLIICGVNGLKYNWLNEIHTHSNESAWILGTTHQSSISKKANIITTQTKIEDLNVLLSGIPDVNHNEIYNAYFIITNIESLRNEEICKLIKKCCDRDIISMIAVDEAHKCKNSTSQQGKALLKLNPRFKMALTGTPVMNTPIDLYTILKWLGYENHTLTVFKNHYCIMGGYGDHEIVGYKNLKELEAKLSNIMLRRLKKDVLDLPEKVHINEFVEMTSKQSSIYNEIETELRKNVDLIKSSTTPLSMFMRLRQSTGYTGIVSSTIRESAKLERMLDLVEEATANGNSVVIFSNWTQMTTPVYKLLTRHHYVGGLITGDVDTKKRDLCVKKFQNGDYKFLVGTIGAMGTGLTLTAANTVIFLDEPWTMADKEQAEDRCHRIGQSESLTVYTIMCKDTIDERVHEIITQKGELSDMIVDGKIRYQKSELIDYLLKM